MSARILICGFTIASYFAFAAPSDAAPGPDAQGARYPTCTQAQAYNKMLALGRAQARIMAANPSGGQTIGARISIEVSRVGQVLADKKFSEACAKYDEIAGRYDLDLKKESNGLITYEELAKDGGKRGGICSQADASKKVIDLNRQVSEKVSRGESKQDAFQQFNEDAGRLSELLYTDPSKMCASLDGLKGKYGLN